MNDVATVEDLFKILKANQPRTIEELDISTVKYALYARKSTTDEERQERSVDDQITDCIDRVIDLNDKIKLVQEPIRESHSAKEPDVRPKFRKLIEDIKSGRVTGLIAWHPDRLARNMKEAGEIIDLLDKGTLKDLKFATSTFENNPTGKMLLGISFVLSKQYAEHLSESVNRGNQRMTEDGEFIGKMKHGYYINNDRKLFPDGDNFLYIKKAFQMRIEGVSQKEIAAWLNTTSYEVRRYKQDLKRVVWDKDMVSKMLRDPVYAGVLKYGNHLVDLTSKYDFTPIIEVRDFLKLNKISRLDSTKLISSMMVKGGDIRANLLRGIVFCGHCNKPFSSALVDKKLKSGPISYYTYRCDNEECIFKGKSVRANVVLGCAKDFFSGYLFTTKDNYEQYISDAKNDIAVRTKEINSNIASLSKIYGEKNKEYGKTKDLILNNPVLSSYYNLKGLKSEVEKIYGHLEGLKTQRNDIKYSIFTYEKYLKLFENVSVIVGEMQDMRVMDKVLRKFFSNFTIIDHGKDAEQRYDVSYYLNEPWAGFIKTGKFVRGRGERTQTFDLSVPNRARYQLRHTPMVLLDEL